MKFELALKLKDAGFPMHDFQECEVGNCWKNKHEEHCYPTLSELIDAIGDNFFLEHYGSSDCEWLASKDVDPNDGQKHLTLGEGSTHIEAVVNLWLILNQK